MSKADERADLIEKWRKTLNVPEVQVIDALDYLRNNPVLSKILDLLFDAAIETQRNALENVEPEKLREIQGVIKGLKSGKGIVKGQVDA